MKKILRYFRNKTLFGVLKDEGSGPSIIKCPNPKCGRQVEITLINPQQPECWFCAASCRFTEAGVFFSNSKTTQH